MTQGRSGNWTRRLYEVPDARLVQAEREIYNLFGDDVSVDAKAKSLVKFGKSAPLSKDETATVWTVGDNEIYVDDSLITHVVSSSASDVYELWIECHTVTGTGEDQKFTFLVQTVTLNGQTPVELPIPVARVSLLRNNNGTEFVGQIAAYEGTSTVTAGVPDDITKVHDRIEPGFQNSFKGATTLSDKDYYIVTGGFGSVSSGLDATANFYLEVRQAGKVFTQGAAISGSRGGQWAVDLDPAIIIPANSDVRITCSPSANGATVFGTFQGYLAKVIN